MTIDDVIARLGQIVEDSLARGSRLGYFPAMYQQVTAKVKAGIAGGRFEDGPRMERLDVVFAQRYLDAYDDARASRPVTGSWRLAFASAERGDLIALQHLLLGMNAHIGLDLGVAAAQVAPGDALPGLRRDFDEINLVLLEMLGGVQKQLGSVSPSLRLLDALSGRSDAEVAAFGLVTARNLAWNNAVALSVLDRAAWPGAIAALDTAVETAGRLILAPGPLAHAAVGAIHLSEVQDPRRVIQALALS